MHDMTKRENARNAGFTLTELLVLVGVGAVLSGVLLADFSQTRSELLRDACAANMKQWGLAFRMYADDYNGTFYYDAGGLHFSDIDTPLASYILGSNIVGSNRTAAMRTLRVCPSRLGQINLNGPTGVVGYNMPIGSVHFKGGFIAANTANSPFYENSVNPYWPNLTNCHNTSQFVLLLECNGGTVGQGGFKNAVTFTGVSVDPVIPIDRHLSVVNVLFGDNHVESCTLDRISAMDNAGPGGPYSLMD